MIPTWLTLKISAIGIGVLLGGSGLAWAHFAAIRNAKQLQEAETRSEVQNELAARHAIETKQREERILELEQRLVELAKTRLGSVRVVEVTAKQSEIQREEAPKLDTNTRRAEIRARINRPAGTAAPAQ